MNREEGNKGGFPYWFYLLRGFAVFFIVLIIKSVMGIRVLDIYSDMEINLTGRGAVYIPFWIISTIYLVGAFFLLNSTLNLFATYDKRAMKKFLLSNPKKIRIRESFKIDLTSREYWVEAIPLFFFTIIGTLVGWYPEVSGSFSATGASAVLLYLLPIIIMPALTFFLTLWRRYEARRYWLHLLRIDNVDKLYGPIRLFIRCITIPLLYICFYPLAPSLGLVFVSISTLLILFIDFLSLIGFLLAVICIIILCLGISALRAIRKRAKFTKWLLAVAEENGYTVSQIKRPYASLFVKRRECNFTLSKDNKIFSVHFIGSFWQRAPLFFVSDSRAYYMHRIGTKNHHITLLSTFDYDFDGEGDKILLLNPVPRAMFAANDENLTGVGVLPFGIGAPDSRYSALFRGVIGRHERSSTRRLEPGDKIWSYAVYNSTALISAIDHECLGRYNGRFE